MKRKELYDSALIRGQMAARRIRAADIKGLSNQTIVNIRRGKPVNVASLVKLLEQVGLKLKVEVNGR